MTMIMAIFGLSIMEDCVINNECSIEHTPDETDFEQYQFDALWVMLTILPIATMAFMVYFMLFTNPDFKFPKNRGKKNDQ
jgi:hypothetical protein